MNRVTAIVPAAGLGTRMGAETPKQFPQLDGVPLLLFTLRRLAACPAIADFYVATRGEEVDSVSAQIAREQSARFASFVAATHARIPSPMRWRRSHAIPTWYWCTMRCGPWLPGTKSSA